MNMRFFLLIAVLMVGACASTPPDDYSDLSGLEKRYVSQPDNVYYARSYARALLQHDDPQTAKAVMVCVLERDDVKAGDYLLAADIYAALEDKDAQYAALEEALAMTPDDLVLRKKMIALYKADEQPALAQPLYDDLLYTARSYSLSEADYVSLVDDASMNLIAQKLYGDAFDLTKLAQERYPHNTALERNSRIIRALMQSHGHGAPKPAARPQHAVSSNS